MKSLINIASCLTLMLFFSGCSVYQHVTIESNAPKNDHSEFIVENDTVSIIYSFHGMGGSISIDLFNKLNKPLYVDWRKSALIMEDESFSLWKDEASVKGVSSSVQVTDDQGVTYSNGKIGGSLVKNETVSFIPPASKIVVNKYNLNAPYFNIPKENGKKFTFYANNGDEVKARKFTFTPDDTPYMFRIFLSLCTDDSFKTPFQFDNSFWVSECITTKAGPKAFDIYFGNQFYNENENTGGNKMLAGVLLSAIVVAAASVKTPPNQ